MLFYIIIHSIFLIALLCSFSDVHAQNSTSTTTTTTSATTTTTILPGIVTTAGQLPESKDPLEVMMKFQPKVSPDTPSNILAVTTDVLRYRDNMRALVLNDVAGYLNIPNIYVTVGNFLGDSSDASFSGKVSITNVYNTSDYLYHLRYYVSAVNAVPHNAFPRMTDLVLGSQSSVSSSITIQGLRLLEVYWITVDTSNPACFLGQDQCVASYIISLGIIVIAGVVVYFGFKKLFNFWKDTAPTRDKTFNQEGGRSNAELNEMTEISNDRGGHDQNQQSENDVSLMQQYHHQEQQRQRIQNSDHNEYHGASRRHHPAEEDVTDML